MEMCKNREWLIGLFISNLFLKITKPVQEKWIHTCTCIIPAYFTVLYQKSFRITRKTDKVTMHLMFDQTGRIIVGWQAVSPCVYGHFVAR